MSFCFRYCFFELIRPHAHAVEILCGQHLMMNVYHFFKHTHMKQNVAYQLVFFCHLFLNLATHKKNHHSDV